MMFLKGRRKFKCKPQWRVLRDRLPLQVDEDGGGGELLHAGGTVGVGDGKDGLVLVHVVQPQHGNKVRRGVLLD